MSSRIINKIKKYTILWKSDVHKFKRGLLNLSGRTLIIYLTLAIAIPASLFFLFSGEVEAVWFDEGWGYRQEITVTVTTDSSDITSLQTLLTVDTATPIAAGKMQSACEDLRFTNANGKLLPYYIDSACDNASTKIWVIADLVPKNTTTYVMYVYYGNSTAPAGTTTEHGLNLLQGLAGYWTMNESSWTVDCSTTSVKDSSVEGNHGKSCPNTTGPAGGATGNYANAGDFDGSDDYVNIDDTPSLDFGSNDFTTTAWSRTDIVDSNYYIIYDKRDSSTDGMRITIKDNDKYECLLNTINVDSVSTALQDTWTHTTCVRNGNNLSIYVNGVFENSVSVSGQTMSVSAVSTIGARSFTQTSANFNGKIDETRVYNRALSAKEISQLYTDPGTIATTATTTSQPSTAFDSEEVGPGPIAYWKFDLGYGTTAQDSTVENNDGTITGPTWQTEDMCVNGKCLSFDGTNDYVDTTTALTNSLATTTAGTWSAWVKPIDATPSAVEYFLSFGDTNAAPFVGLNIQTNGIVRGFMRTAAGTQWHLDSDDAAFSDNTWTHLALVQDGTEPVLYVDGVAVAQTFVTDTDKTAWFSDIAGLDNGRIGNLNKNSVGEANFFNGFIDEVKIYPYARTAAQIKADAVSRGTSQGLSAALGASVENRNAALSSGLVGYWKMDDAGIDAEGEISTDSSGNSNNGTLFGDDGSGDNGTGMDCTASGQFSTGCDFDGTDDYVQIDGLVTTLAQDTVGTISLWAKIDSDDGNQNLPFSISNDASATRTELFIDFDMRTGNDEFHVVLQKDGTQQWAFNSGMDSIDSYVANWVHVTVVQDGVEPILYINGVNQSIIFTTTVDKTLWFKAILTDATTKSDTANIGLFETNSTDLVPFDGTVDEVRIYNKALSSREVRDLYNFAPGPIAHWTFDEGSLNTCPSNNDACDISGNANHGEENGSMTSSDYVPGKYGKALNFDGTNDEITIPNITLGTVSTLSVWAKVDSTDTACTVQTLMSDGTSAQNGFYLADSGGTCNQINYRGDSGAAVESVQVTPSGFDPYAWNHYVGVSNASGLFVYLNGKLVGSLTSGFTNTTISNATYYIGHAATHVDRFWQGQIDDVRMYNYDLTLAQVVSVMGARRGENTGGNSVTASGEGAFLYYKLDEQQGQTINDSGFGSNDSTRGATSTATTDDPTWKTEADCRLNGCLDFDGSADFLESSGTNELDLHTTGTLSAWVWLDTLAPGNNEYFITYGDAASGNNYLAMGFYDTDDKLIIATRHASSSNDYNRVSDVALSASVWQHVAVTNDGSDWKFYINGVDVGDSVSVDDSGTANEGDWFDDVSSGAERLTIGQFGRNTDQLYINGKMDDVKIYNYALTAEDIAKEYTSGSAIALGGTTTQEAVDLTDGAGNPPVGYWTFNEGYDNSCAGGTNDACDTSGNGYDGAKVSAPIWLKSSQCHEGQCMDFDGTNDYVDFGDNLDLIGSPISISAWVNADEHKTYNAVVDKLSSNGNYRLYVKNGIPGFGIRNSGGTYEEAVGSALNTGQWYHLVATYDNSTTGKIYVDGVLDVTKTNFTVSRGNTGTTLKIGYVTNNVVYYDGKIDEVRIYDYVLTQSQVSYLYNRGRPVAHWRFDECEGTIAYDVSGNANNGTITPGAGNNTAAGTCTSGNTAHMWNDGVTGKLNSSLDFDGTDDYVQVNSATALSPTDQVSVSAWFKTSGAMSAAGYIYDRLGSNDGFGLLLDSSGNPKLSINGGLCAAVSAVDADDGGWHHAVGIYNKDAGGTDEGKIYVDGVERGTCDYATAITYSPEPRNQIGRTLTGSNHFSGQIDDVRIYNYALSATQIQKIMQDDSAVRFGPTTGQP